MSGARGPQDCYLLPDCKRCSATGIKGFHDFVIIILSGSIMAWLQMLPRYGGTRTPDRTQKLGGVQALTTMHFSLPMLRKRCGLVLAKR